MNVDVNAFILKIVKPAKVYTAFCLPYNLLTIGVSIFGLIWFQSATNQADNDFLDIS